MIARPASLRKGSRPNTRQRFETGPTRCFFPAVSVVLAFAIAGCGPSPEDTARAAYAEAAALSEAGDLGRSEEILVELLAGAPGPVTAEAERLLGDVRARQEEAVLGSIREIHQAQTDFMARERRYAQFFDALVEGGYLDAPPDGLGTGWDLRMRPSPAADSYTLSAEPGSGASGKRFFFSDETGVIRWERGRPATVDSAALPD